MITFLTDGDHESISPKNTMKKSGPHRSQSLSAFTEHKLPIRIQKHHQLQITHDHRQIPLHSITHRLRQRVRRRPEPAPTDRPRTFEMPKLPAGRSDGGAGTGGTFWEVEEEDGGSGGRLDWTKGEEDGMGTEGRIGLGGRAGRMVPGPDWNPPFILFSISSMSDW